MIVSLSILNLDLNHLEEALKHLRYAPLLHMDIMDGNFVENVSFDEKIVKRAAVANPCSVIDVHLMTVTPGLILEKYAEAGADYITFHLETGNINENIEKIHSLKVKAGLSIKPETDVKELIPYLSNLEYVLIMSVEPGKGGQSFMPSAIEKVKFLSEYKKEHNLHYVISIDGGINIETAGLVKDYVDIAVIGTAITKAADPVKVFKEFLSLR
ncbi:MAG: ribulose-phosphate 3-epimerase [Bacillales bacterium]|nr:ribulose-phosphate 3-epimerase [Bacillales bacterium]